MTRTRTVAAIASVSLLLAGGGLATLSSLSHQPATGDRQLTDVNPISITASTGSTAADYTKDQNVYGMLDLNGRLQKVSIINQFTVGRSGRLTDYGHYRQVQNLSSTKPLASHDGRQSSTVSKGTFYYQGDLTADQAPLPWTIDISYSLDGRPVTAKALAGAHGRVSLHIKVSQNPAADPTTAAYFDKYLLQISFTVPIDSVRKIDAGATGIVSDAGADKQITFMSMPGKAGDFGFSADVSDFSMSAVSLAAAPFALDVNGLVDTRSLTTGMNRLTDGMTQLAAGSTSLDSGSRQLAAGLSQLDNGVAQVTAGAGQLKDGAADLDRGIKDYAGGVSQLADGSHQAAAGVKQVSDGLTEAAHGGRQLADGLQAQADQLAQQASPDALKQAGTAYQDALKDYSTDLGLLAMSDVTKLLAFMQVSTGLPDPVADPAAYRTALVKAIDSQADSDVKNMLNRVLGLFDTQTALNQLSGQTGAAQALSGAAQGAKKVSGGLEQLAAGASAATTGVQALDSGLSQAATGGQQLTQGADQYLAGLTSFTDGLKSLQTGADALSDNSSQLTDGTAQLSSGLQTMARSTAKIPAALRQQLAQVAKTFSGQVKPTDFVDQRNNPHLAQVQFMLTTQPIEKATSPKPATEPRVPSFWERLRNLFVDVKED